MLLLHLACLSVDVTSNEWLDPYHYVKRAVVVRASSEFPASLRAPRLSGTLILAWLASI